MSHDKPPHVLYWDCQKHGCFNQKKRLKFQLLSDCLPGRIAFTDIDALTEINGNLLVLEWKDHTELTRGQRILFERLTLLCPAAVLVVEGDAEQMIVSHSLAWRRLAAGSGEHGSLAARDSSLGPMGNGQPRFAKETKRMNEDASVTLPQEGLTRFATGAVRGTDADGERWDLITPIGLRRLAETCAEGARKYGAHNWTRGIPASVMLNHAIRHIYLYLAGDRGEDHLAHAAWNILGVCHFEETLPEMIDIPTRNGQRTS